MTLRLTRLEFRHQEKIYDKRRTGSDQPTDAKILGWFVIYFCLTRMALYQGGDLLSQAITTTIANFLVEKQNLKFELVALPASIVATREYEIWFGTKGAPPEEKAYKAPGPDSAPAAPNEAGAPPP